jgi:hypothetical protein
MLDLVEKALNEIACPIEIFAEADRGLASGFGRNVRPRPNAVRDAAAERGGASVYACTARAWGRGQAVTVVYAGRAPCRRRWGLQQRPPSSQIAARPRVPLARPGRGGERQGAEDRVRLDGAGSVCWTGFSRRGAPPGPGGLRRRAGAPAGREFLAFSQLRLRAQR